MKRREISILVIFFSLAMQSHAAAENPAHRLPKKLDSQVAGFMEPFVKNAMFDGTILVDVGGEIVYEKSFGLASVELGVAHTLETKFRVASLSKGVTDAAIGRLIDDGVLSFETPVSRYLPDFPSAGAITIRHLLEHTSGIPHTNNQDWGKGEQSWTLDEIVEKLSKLPLDFEPGSKTNYSNGGYAVLAKILALETDRDYAGAMEELVFEPLGMADTGHIENSRDVISKMAEGYEPGPVAGERRRPRPYAAETRYGGGSLYSTARDMRLFYRAFLDNKLMKVETREAIFRPRDAVVEQTGRSPGYSLQARLDPETDSIVIVLANNYAFGIDLDAAVFAMLQGRQPDWAPLEFDQAEVAEDDPRIGHYVWPDFIGAEGDIVLTAAGNLAFTDKGNDYSSALLPTEGGGFVFTMYYFLCEPADDDTRDYLCRPLSGSKRYNARLTRSGD